MSSCAADLEATRPIAPSAEPGTGIFVTILGPGEYLVVPLALRRSLVLGRGTEADVRVADPALSRRHLALRCEGESATLTDLGSANGTQVNGSPVSGTACLRPGDVVEAGATRLLILSGSAPHPERPAALAHVPVVMPLGPGAEALFLDPVMVELVATARLLAPSDLPVLLCGETGTGKDVFARAMHELSGRTGPLVPISCARLPDAIADSELFGHARGAFTGASAARAGFVEQSSGGTLLLDEVSELSPRVQAKFVRILEERSVMRLGEGQARSVDVRIMATSSRNLGEEVSAGRFRSDLWFRLNATMLTLPPLRHRLGEVTMLARHFAEEAAARRAMAPLTIPAPTLFLLGQHSWPGNVRELRNVIERAAVLATSPVLETWMLPPEMRERADEPSMPVAPAERESLADELHALERKRIVEALAATDGVQVRAAVLLRMPLRTFQLRVKQYGLQGPAAGRAKLEPIR